MFNRTNPEAAIFTGTFKDGVTQLTLDKVLATDSEGCSPSSMSITAFGSGSSLPLSGRKARVSGVT